KAMSKSSLKLYWLLLCLFTSQAQAWHDETYADEPAADEEQLLVQFQLGYEQWERQCEPYEKQAEPAVSTRIARGQLAEPGMFPFQAGLLLQLRNGSYRQCGGSLISLSFVLTAAHCLKDVASGVVYLGSNNYAVAATAAERFEVQTQQFIIYPGYLGFGGYNDLALIQLPKQAQRTAKVQPIRLAQRFMRQSYLQGQLVSSAGWGALGDGKAERQSLEPTAEDNLLHYVDVQVMEQQRCICYFLPGLVSAHRHICTDGRGGRGACDGDSGGPLVYQWRNVSYLIGLTTFGTAEGCELNGPTVYTRLTAYLEWISAEMGLHV
ncbi:CG6462, partial [Drosophila busckii]